MAKKAIAAKKRVVKIEGVGQLHVMSSFNNVIVQLLTVKDKLSVGVQLVNKVSVAAKRILRTQHKWQQQTAVKWHLTLVCVK